MKSKLKDIKVKCPKCKYLLGALLLEGEKEEELHFRLDNKIMK